MSVRAQRVLLLEAFSSKEDPDRTASEHDNGPLPPFVTTANPTERARETYAYAEEIDVSELLREPRVGLRVARLWRIIFCEMELDSICGFSYVPSCPRKIPPPRESRLPLDNRAS